MEKIKSKPHNFVENFLPRETFAFLWVSYKKKKLPKLIEERGGRKDKQAIKKKKRHDKKWIFIITQFLDLKKARRNYLLFLCF